MGNPGFSNRKLERLVDRPFYENGLARWAAWESERTGFGLGFRAAAFLPPFLPLRFTSDHYSNPITALRDNEISRRFGVHLVWYARKAELLNKNGVPAECVRHPWSFLPLRTRDLSRGEGSLYFLPHGHGGIDIEVDWGGLKRQLKNLPQKYHPVTVCVGAYEIRRGAHYRIREKLDLPLVTAGSTESQLFPFRFWNLLNRFSFTTGSSLDSHVFYSIWAGRAHYLLPSGPVAILSKADELLGRAARELNWLEDYPDEYTRLKMRRFAESLSSELNCPSAFQKQFVKECLVSDEALSRWETMKLIWSQLRYRPVKE